MNVFDSQMKAKVIFWVGFSFFPLKMYLDAKLCSKI